MKTLLTFLLLSGSAFCQQNDFPPYPGYPDAQFAQVHEWKDHPLNIDDMIATAAHFAPLAFRPPSYTQWLADQEPKFIPPPKTKNPIRITNNRGQLQGTIQTRPNGTVVLRDRQGRTVQTATLKAGTYVIENAKKGVKK